MNRASRAAVLELVAVFAVFAVLDALRIRLTLPRGLFGDEWRYLYYADNLLHGFYSPPERVYIVNGPGYPLLLLPFVARGWTEGARYANAVWHAGTMVYAWAVLRPYLRLPWRIVAVAALGWYGPLVAHVPLLYTEVVCCFFVSGWLYHALRSQRVAAGLYLGALCMTKVIFGMGLVVFVALTAGVWLYRRSPLVARHLIISLLALALCVPFETYTHRLTGRWLYWSSSGGNNFYWLTSPYPEESGDWYHHGWVRDNAMLRAHHRAVFDEASGLRDQPNLDEKEQFFNLGRPEAADVFLREGLRNVREHPVKFLRNYLANIARLFFDVPTSVRGTPVVNRASVWNLGLLLWTGYVAWLAWRRRVAVPEVLWPCLGFGSITLLGYTLSSLEARFLIPFVPLWWLATWLWLAAIRARG